jgi:hypothetical protein
MNALPLLFAAIALVLAAALLVRGVFLGYPRAALPGAMLSRKEQAIVAVCADALFPPGGPIPISGTEAGLVRYMDQYLRRLPPFPRLLGRLLFHSVEHGPWVFGPRMARFTRLRPEERIAMLGEMAQSRLYFRRISFLSMRTMMTMGYLAHPDVARALHIVPDAAPFEPHEASPDRAPASLFAEREAYA